MCTVYNIYITAHHILILCIYIYTGKLGKLRRPHCDLTGRMVSRGNDPKIAWFREACWQLASWFCVFLYFSFFLLCGVGWVGMGWGWMLTFNWNWFQFWCWVGFNVSKSHLLLLICLYYMQSFWQCWWWNEMRQYHMPCFSCGCELTPIATRTQFSRLRYRFHVLCCYMPFRANLLVGNCQTGLRWYVEDKKDEASVQLCRCPQFESPVQLRRNSLKTPRLNIHAYLISGLWKYVNLHWFTYVYI